jgi:hypothetical protein
MAVADLAEKYRRMLALRARLIDGGEAAARDELRALATAWPGALRELDTLPTDEIAARLAALEAVAAGAPPPSWAVWMDGYHALVRVAIALRARDAVAAERLALDAALTDEERALLARPPHGRVMAAVFTILGARHGADARALWDALFPPRGARPRPYRDG